MKISGHGGFGVLESVNGVALAGGSKRFENNSYEADVEALIDEVTDSGSAGTAEGLPVGVTKVNGLVFEVTDRDDASFLLVLGMTEGQVVSLYVRRGAKAAFNKFTGCIVRNVRETNPQNAARRVTVTCEYGKYERGVTAPTFT